jgi:hypothetical protein
MYAAVNSAWFGPHIHGSTNRGKSWKLPERRVGAEVRPQRICKACLYQQNHCGIYRAKLTADRWTDISRGLPSWFGFGLAVPAESNSLFTVPIEASGYRCNRTASSGWRAAASVYSLAVAAA